VTYVSQDQQTIVNLRQLQSQQRIQWMEARTAQLNAETQAIEDGQMTPDQAAVTNLRQLPTQQPIIQMQGDQGVPQDRMINDRLATSWQDILGRRPDYDNGPATYGRMFPNQKFTEQLGDSKAGQSILWQGVDAMNGYPGAQELGSSLRQGAMNKSFGADDIKNLQAFLQKEGLDLGPGGVDGKFGPKTHEAMMQFASIRSAERESNMPLMPRFRQPEASYRQPQTWTA